MAKLETKIIKQGGQDVRVNVRDHEPAKHEQKQDDSQSDAFEQRPKRRRGRPRKDSQ